MQHSFLSTWLNTMWYLFKIFVNCMQTKITYIWCLPSKCKFQASLFWYKKSDWLVVHHQLKRKDSRINELADQIVFCKVFCLPFWGRKYFQFKVLSINKPTCSSCVTRTEDKNLATHRCSLSTNSESHIFNHGFPSHGSFNDPSLMWNNYANSKCKVNVWDNERSHEGHCIELSTSRLRNYEWWKCDSESKTFP